ncbi:hypothetical protein HYFRA_00007011 [Hymenoscyphus fraxineus]|uniref:Uncharacterized protein n=1 Tax=Hymenoscyphus fraxineus TaxID=746836 RepID=A0A9N9KNC8_9HELO|nr:hypothetical protein HYFRA_00007011 [Hymenoscyphus fraxineus]
MVQFNTTGFPDVPTGRGFFISWVEAKGPVALTLLAVPYNEAAVPQVLGDAGAMIENQTVIRIASSLNGSPYRWQVPLAWEEYGKLYEMVIDDDDSYAFSGQFRIVSFASQTSFMLSGSSVTPLPTKTPIVGLGDSPSPSPSILNVSTNLPSTIPTSSTAMPTLPPPAVDESSPSNRSTKSSSLSTGAKAGIGVGCVAAVFILISLAAFFYFKKRNAARNQTPEIVETADNNWQENGKAELSAAPLRAAEIGDRESNLSAGWTDSWRNTHSTATVHERSELVGSVVGGHGNWRMSELEGSVVGGSHRRMVSSDSINSQTSELEGTPATQSGHNRVVSSDSIVSSMASPRIGSSEMRSSGLRRSELSSVGMGIGDEVVVER